MRVCSIRARRTLDCTTLWYVFSLLVCAKAAAEGLSCADRGRGRRCCGSPCKHAPSWLPFLHVHGSLCTTVSGSSP